MKKVQNSPLRGTEVSLSTHVIDQQVAQIEVPAGLKYDGHMMDRYAQFTEYDESLPSFGASFYLEDGQITTESLAARRTEVRDKFAK